ncbi:lipopolysaccharide assembly protein LapA domain-containing protein [Carnobacterium sp.]|uniref:LapA family protein n=1 Tax=Carnobacterium sp. TaxID=48221 RepID=UPI0028AEC934|nr:lipopolysaccharide assembly protein LapA domain-containing protein [Carnobacterium sp.]
MKKQWGTVLAIILVLLIALFAVLNVADVPVNFGFALVTWPLIMVILGSLFIGALITVLIATSTAFRTKKKIKNYESDLSNAEETKQQELKQVREEYEHKITEKDEKIIEQANKIDSLEKELVERMTATTPTPPTS